MCIIIVNKQGMLSKTALYNCWDSNPDGAGLMYAENGKIVIEKELMKKKLFYNLYRDIRKRHNDTIILHFRIGTSGKKDFVNCHPFEVNSDLAFCHNGIIPETTLPGSPISDTVVFNQNYLQKLPENWIESPVIKELIASFIGSSKLAFLHASGQVTLINSHLGHWDTMKENWYSNYSYIRDEYNFNTWVKPSKENKLARYWHEDNYKGYSLPSLHEPSVCEYCGKPLFSKFDQDNGICRECYNYFYDEDAKYDN